MKGDASDLPNDEEGESDRNGGGLVTVGLKTENRVLGMRRSRRTLVSVMRQILKI